VRRLLAIAAALAAATAACGPSRQGGYPSYEAVISQYVPPGGYAGQPLGDGLPRPDGSTCDCPRLWYGGHWVYYYHGHWIYWHRGYWYYYPYFYVYYWGGVPHVYQGPHYGIRKTGGAPGEPAASAPGGIQPSARPSPPPSRSAAPPPSRGGGADRSSSPPSRGSDPDRRR